MKIFALSGLGADQRVFQFLYLEHELIPIDWMDPWKEESLKDYTARLIALHNFNEIKEFAILGVSFGGLLAMEISKIVHPKSTILISSVETRNDLPYLYRLFGKLDILSLIPDSLLIPPTALAAIFFGTQKKELLGEILKDTDPKFAKWALQALLNWKNEKRLSNVLKISGTKDLLLSPRNSDSIFVEGGGHFMIVDKAKEISEIINASLRNK